ncbi:C-type lectin domain family 6 member A-like [Enoplosus armatus]|uniref:C-type lectin domain family 6 member A-like n=1 Tax=Enoplosus armatus TaxID=215367 RepID=UPI00399695D6
MSSDIYAKPDFLTTMRYNRKVQEDKAEWEEREVDIYESADVIRDDHNDFQSHEGGQHSEDHRPAVQRRPFSAAALCLGLLCLLLITGIILLSIHFTLEKDQLQNRYDKLSNNYSQLQGKISGKWCPEGWKRFGCSCYFKSNEQKTWDDSRTDCQDKGAHLVIINDKDEQKFVIELNMYGESWIGLMEKWTTTGWQWEWVDRSPLTEMFWATGSPQQPRNHRAACCNQQGQWTQRQYYYYKNWICEK